MVSPSPPPNTGTGSGTGTGTTLTGSALLAWTPPIANTDQSQLTDLAGYRIDYGSSPDALDKSIDVDNAGLDAFVVENLPKGISYFVIKSVNSRGVHSEPSPVISKTIN